MEDQPNTRHTAGWILDGWVNGDGWGSEQKYTMAKKEPKENHGRPGDGIGDGEREMERASKIIIINYSRG
jgi:hypothetical protein